MARFAPLALYALAFGLRLAHLLAMSRAPLFGAELPPWDAYYYRRAAVALAAGDPWSAPEIAWVSSPPYLFFLAGCFALFGENVWVPRLVQIALGSSIPVLLYAVGTRVFDRRVGLVAGVFAALYGLFIFYDVELMKACFDPLLAAATLLLLVCAAQGSAAARSAWAQALAAGVALGLLIQVRGNVLLFAPLALGWLWLATRGLGQRVATERAAALLAGLMFVSLPMALRAQFVPEGRAIFANGAGIHLFIGNHAEANGTYSRVPGVRATSEGHVVDAARVASAAEGRALGPAEVSRYWQGRALAWMAGNPLDFLSLSARKLELFVNVYEIPSNEDFYFTRRFSPVLQLPLVGFGVIAPLGLLGAGLAWRLGSGARLLVLLVATTAASMTLLFVTGRYRMTATPALIVLAAFAIVWLVDRVRTRELRALAAAALAGAVLVAAVHAQSPLSRESYMRGAESQLRTALPASGDAAAREQLALLWSARQLLDAGESDGALDLIERAARLVPGDARSEALRAEAHARGAAPRNPSGGPIVLVAVDTLRADHVSCYGHAWPTTPVLCELARDGLLFEQAFTPRPQTTPALASLMTGLPPHRHGVEQLYQLLPAHHETLAERLRAAGYRTAAFVSSFVMLREMSGLEQGFERYDDTLTRRGATQEGYERPADETLARALSWLDAQPDGRFFLFLHWIEPHGPYTPSLEDARRFRRPRSPIAPAAIPDYQRIPGVERLDEFGALYDGEVAAADRALAGLVAALRARGLYDAATVVVTADHGESQGEEGHWFEHGYSLSQAETRVPLVVKPATDAGAPRGSRIARAVSLEELFPTLLGVAGLVPEARGVARHDLLAPGPDEPGLAISSLVGENGWTAVVRSDRCALRFRIARQSESGSRTRVLPEGVEGDASCRAQLAGRALARLDDLADYRRPFAVTTRGDAFERGFRDDFVARRGDPIVPLDASERERLRSLGYLE